MRHLDSAYIPNRALVQILDVEPGSAWLPHVHLLRGLIGKKVGIETICLPKVPEDLVEAQRTDLLGRGFRLIYENDKCIIGSFIVRILNDPDNNFDWER